MQDAADETETPKSGAGALALAAFFLGFALSGFFDGILLHQVLGWHHLLSALEGDLRFQIVADGWFHVAMYAIAFAGLWSLWCARHSLAGPRARSAVVGWGLIGFGTWHLVDALGSHWLLGLHRIRMDSATPLLWDFGWAGVFGLIPVLAGAYLRRSGGTGGRATTAATMLALATAGGGAWGLLPPPGRTFATVAFADGIAPASAYATAALAGEAVLWSDAAGEVFVIAGLQPLAIPGLFRRGAIFVGGAGLPDGCFAWTETS